LNGIDSSILVYALDPTTDEHVKARDSILLTQTWAINPTVVHESYHTLVFKRGMSPGDGRLKLRALVRDRRTAFLNLTKAVSLYSLDIGPEFNLGGRDALIVGCYLRNGMETMLTHDNELLRLKRLRFKGREIAFVDPLAT
jgi:predicted nucleic acid-binding protein